MPKVIKYSNPAPTPETNKPLGLKLDIADFIQAWEALSKNLATPLTAQPPFPYPPKPLSTKLPSITENRYLKYSSYQNSQQSIRILMSKNNEPLASIPISKSSQTISHVARIENTSSDSCPQPK